MRTKGWIPGLALGLVGILAVCGCDKLTRNHYEMIVQNVSTTDDVARTIGPPSHELPGQWHYTREDKHLTVIIDFSDGDVVVRKQWVDGLAAEWDDTQKPGDTDSYESTKIREINQ
ncbi:MAG: hypothetical protein GY842_07255 [bacterium]|nr:hypothetical protein [bacterium]